MTAGLSSILSIGTSGLQVAQTGLDVVSNNVANVNTPGYVREIANQQSTALAGLGSGVQITGIVRAANQFLEAANLSSQSDSARASAVYGMLDQAQGLFGDPSSSSSFFSSLDDVFSAFSTLAANPTSDQKAAAIGQVSEFFAGSETIQSGLQTLVGQADGQIASDVAEANQLISEIGALNVQISQGNIEGKDATGSQNQQSQLVGQLATLMNITTSTDAHGAVTVRAGDGTVLTGPGQTATLSYDASGPTGQLKVTGTGGITEPLGARLTSGELAGLVDLRNTVLPGLAGQVADLTTAAAYQLNAASNASTAAPAPSSLAGRNTLQGAADAFANFTGKTNVAIVDSTGVIQAQVAIDFDAGTMTVGGVSTGFTPASFASTLNAELGGAGSASFDANGKLTLTASGSGNGVVVADDASDPSRKAGQGFSQFFGLNDLVQAASQPDYATGMTTGSTNGFTAGGQITLRLSAGDGSMLRDVTVPIPSGGTMADVLAALNDPAHGVGLYGSFQLDANGELGFQPANGSDVGVTVARDSSAWGGTGGPSLTQLFGLGDAQRITAANSYAVRSDILQNPDQNLQTAWIDLANAPPAVALSIGSTAGADAIAQAGQAVMQISPSGAQTAVTLSQFSAQLAGSIANAASAAQSAQQDAVASASAAQSRLSSAEGVNIDQELVSLTTYQQAYNASARMIQAAKDMFDTLLGMTGS